MNIDIHAEATYNSQIWEEAAQAASKYTRERGSTDFNYNTGCGHGYHVGYLACYEKMQAENERLRAALEEVHGLVKALRYGIFPDEATVNMLLSKAILASTAALQKAQQHLNQRK